jgi:hypothetical protein
MKKRQRWILIAAIGISIVLTGLMIAVLVVYKKDKNNS